MTPQVALLLLVPIFLFVDILAIAKGRRGTSRGHKMAKVFGITALVALVVFAVALVDLVTQVWVMRPGSVSGAIYAVSGISFGVLSIVSLALYMKLRLRAE